MTKTRAKRRSSSTVEVRQSGSRLGARGKTRRFSLVPGRSDSVQEEEAGHHPSVYSATPRFAPLPPQPAAAHPVASYPSAASYPAAPPYPTTTPQYFPGPPPSTYGTVLINPQSPPSDPYNAWMGPRPKHEPSPAHIQTPAAMPVMTPSPRAPFVLPGPEDYVNFYWKTNDLLSELERLQYALRTVGACGPGIQAIDATYKSFEALQWMFGFNTYSLYPRPQDPRFQLLKTDGDQYLSEFSRTFEHAADALKLMERAFKDYQSVYYENGTMYLLSCLQKRFKSEAMRTSLGKGTYASPPSTEELKKRVQTLLNNFLTKAVETLRKDLSKYSEKGIPVISSAQETKSNRYLNLTTIATFLSAVIAIFLPLSAEQPDGALNVGANTFLFTSLTFSIASAVNSLLALTWFKSVVRDPHSYLPFWVTACLNTGPMITLVAAAALFVVGLCLFVFASGQHIATSIVTVSSAGFFTIGLLALAVWLTIEKWHFRRAAGAAGQNLTGTSLSMTVLEWMVLWPQRISEAFMSTEDPSQIERGPSDHPNIPSTSQAQVLWDGFANNFLYGAHPTTPAYRYGLSGGSQIGSHRPPRPSETGGAVGEQRSSHDNAVPSGPGYAPTEYGGDTDGFDHERIDAEPIVVQPPPVDSQTYETALFLPRDEVTGQYEDIHTSSSDSDSEESDNNYRLRPVVPPQPLPGLTIPAPVPVHFSENVMVIPTNPPTYVVPPGSYVAYGTQPSIGPSAQAGAYAAYNPVQPTMAFIPPPPTPIFIPRPPSPPIIPHRPQTRLGVPAQFGYPPPPEPANMPPLQTPFIPPLDPYTPYILPTSLPDPFSRPTFTPGYVPGQAAPSRPRTPSTYSDGRSYSHEYPQRSDSRSEPTRQDSGMSILRPSMSEVSHYVPSQSRWSAYYPARSPYSSARRCTSTGSVQVRFNDPEVTEPRRRRSTTERSTTSRPETSTSIYSEQLTSEPEEMDTIPETRDEGHSRVSSRGRAQPSLDSLQQRHRQNASDEYPIESGPSSSTSRTAGTLVDPELIDAHVGEPKAPRDESSRNGRNFGDSERHDASLPENQGDRHPQIQSTPLHELSTIDEVTESRDDQDSDSSDDSVATAPETVRRTPQGQ